MLNRKVLVALPLFTVAFVVSLVGGYFAVRAAFDSGSGTAENKYSEFWFTPAFDEDSKKPRLEEQAINGIIIGPDSTPVPKSNLCDTPNSPQFVPPEKIQDEAAGTPLNIDPTYLPEGVTLESREAGECGGTLVANVARYNVKTKENPDKNGPPVIWSGGGFFVSRRLADRSQYPVQAPAERVSGVSVAGHPAVVVSPVMPLDVDAGIGDGTIIIAEEFGTTVIQGNGLPFDEFLKIAESLYPESAQ